MRSAQPALRPQILRRFLLDGELIYSAVLQRFTANKSSVSTRLLEVEQFHSRVLVPR